MAASSLLVVQAACFGTPIPAAAATWTADRLSAVALAEASLLERCKTSPRHQRWKEKRNARSHPAGQAGVLFVTGATGFCGAFFVAELLRSRPPGTTAVCLARAGSDAEATARVNAGFAFWRIGTAPGSWRAVAGDLGKERFGLADEEYLRIRDQVTEIWHAGAVVSGSLPFEELREHNVAGTRRVAQLAADSGGAPLFFLSTMAVAPDRAAAAAVPPPGGKAGGSGHHPRPMPERGFSPMMPIRSRRWPRALQFSSYAMSKWAAESLLQEACRSHGLRVVAFRLGTM